MYDTYLFLLSSSFAYIDNGSILLPLLQVCTDCTKSLVLSWTSPKAFAYDYVADTPPFGYDYSLSTVFRTGLRDFIDFVFILLASFTVLL